jgi:hypothetical protein
MVLQFVPSLHLPHFNDEIGIVPRGLAPRQFSMLRGLLYVSGDSEDEVDESKSDALLQQQHVMTPNANNVLDPAMEITNQSNVLDSDLNGCTACDKRTPSSKCVPNNDSNAKCTSSGKHLSIIDDDKHPGVSSR